MPATMSRLRRRQFVRLFWLGLTQILVIGLFVAPLRGVDLFAPDPAFLHTTATLVRLEPPGAPPLQVTLPHNLLASPGGFVDRYDIDVSLADLDATAPLALYIPYTSRDMDIRFNDIIVFEIISKILGDQAEHPDPVLVRLPLATSGNNASKISITYTCRSMRCTTASRVYVGPPKAFRFSFISQALILNGILYFYVGALLLGVGCTTVGLWLGFSGSGLSQARTACVVLLINRGFALLPDLPASVELLAGWLPILAMTILVQAEFYLLRLELKRRSLLLYAPTCLVCAVVLLVGTGERTVAYLQIIAVVSLIALIVVHNTLIWRYASRRKLRLLLLLAVPGILVTGRVCDEALFLLGFTHQDALLTPSLGPLLAVFTVLLLLGQGIWSFSIRYNRLIHQVPEKLRDLEMKLATRYRQELLLQRKLWLLQERGRLMSDLHDGLGGALVSIIAASESEQFPRSYIYDAARTALNEMRLIVDALDSADGDLRQVLSSWQARNALRMEPFAIALEVDFQSSGRQDPTIGTGSLVNFLRILDELATNACKHSGGTRVCVTISSVADDHGQNRCYVTFTDDGHGFPTVVPQGRGMAALQQRAQAIGANITIIATRVGTMVTLLIPPTPPGEEAPASPDLWGPGPEPSR